MADDTLRSGGGTSANRAFPLNVAPGGQLPQVHPIGDEQ
jgi:hypothetical protein